MTVKQGMEAHRYGEVIFEIMYKLIPRGAPAAALAQNLG